MLNADGQESQSDDKRALVRPAPFDCPLEALVTPKELGATDEGRGAEDCLTSSTQSCHSVSRVVGAQDDRPRMLELRRFWGATATCGLRNRSERLKVVNGGDRVSLASSRALALQPCRVEWGATEHAPYYSCECDGERAVCSSR
jgi:hypothetical protein